MNFFSSMECNKRGKQCRAWCIVNSECRITKFLISPLDGPQDSDHVTCYTNQRLGNQILKATATSSAYDTSPPSILTKGIFNADYATTAFNLRSGANPYILFEFPSEILVRAVIISIAGDVTIHPSSQTEIRIGSSMPGGPTDFSQLELVGTFDDPRKWEWRVFNPKPPKKIKYLAILETD